MNFKTTLFAVQAATLLSLPLSFAQNVSGGGPDTHIDIVHDKPENDPSDPSKALTLKKVVLQKDFAIHETLKKMAQSAEQTLVDFLNPFST